MNNEDLYYGIKCSKCNWVGSSQESLGGGQIADTGDYSELLCPTCEYSALDDASEAELCNEIVRLRAPAAPLPEKPLDMEKEITSIRNYIARSALYYLEEGKENREKHFEMAEWGLNRIQHALIKAGSVSLPKDEG